MLLLGYAKTRTQAPNNFKSILHFCYVTCKNTLVQTLYESSKKELTVNTVLIDNEHLEFLHWPVVEEVSALLERNDLAHRADHVAEVVNYAAELADRLELPETERQLLLTAALMHDIGCFVSRDLHHEIGAAMALDLLRAHEFCFSFDDVATIVEAISQHRGSFKGVRKTRVSELLRVADAGRLSPVTFGDRAITYRLERGEFIGKPAELVNDACKHLRDKWGTEGYNWPRYPAIGLELNKDAIDQIKVICDNHDLLRDYVESRYTALNQ